MSAWPIYASVRTHDQIESQNRGKVDGFSRCPIEEMQVALDAYLVISNTKQSHQGCGMNGRTPAKAFVQGVRKPTKKEVKPDLMTAA